MKYRNDLTCEYVRSILHYNPDTGIFTWIKPAAKCMKIGDVAGTVRNHGYHVVVINYIAYLSHRLAYLYMIGLWPEEEVDHKDMNRTNNKWENLRACHKRLNKGNTKKQSDNKSGFKGVSWCKVTNKWRAQITVNGKKKMLGCYVDINDAANAYNVAAKQGFGEFARIN